jgi:hypothetical protein
MPLFGRIFGVRDVTFDRAGNLTIETHEPPGSEMRFISFEKADLPALLEAIKNGPQPPKEEGKSLVDAVRENWLRKRRPQNYHELSPEEQWAADKRIEGLDK